MSVCDESKSALLISTVFFLSIMIDESNLSLYMNKHDKVAESLVSANRGVIKEEN